MFQQHRGSAEFLCEAFKAVGEYGNNTHSSMVNLFNFNADVVASAGSVGRAIYGLDVDAFGRSDTESGINTIRNNPITIITQSAVAYATPLNVYNILFHDIVLAVTPDGQFSCSK